MPRRSTRPCDIAVTADMRMMFFDYGIEPGCFYWNIHGQVVLTIKGRPDAVIAATPLAAIKEAGENGGL